MRGMREALTHLLFAFFKLTDDFDEEEMGMMAMLEEVRKEGGGRERRKAGEKATIHHHILTHLLAFPLKQEESDVEAEEEDDDDDLEGEEEEDEFEEEQDVDLFLGNMDYREDDEVGREGRREGGREEECEIQGRSYPTQEETHFEKRRRWHENKGRDPLVLPCFQLNTNKQTINRTPTTAGNGAGKPRTARLPTRCKTRSWNGLVAFMSTTTGGTEREWEGVREGGKEWRLGRKGIR